MNLTTRLPKGIALVRLNVPSGKLVMGSDMLTDREEWIARVAAAYRSLVLRERIVVLSMKDMIAMYHEIKDLEEDAPKVPARPVRASEPVPLFPRQPA